MGKTELTNSVKKRKIAKAYSNHIIFSFLARRRSVDVGMITFGNVRLYNATYYSFVLDHEVTQNT